jgi:hypothetical protein
VGIAGITGISGFGPSACPGLVIGRAVGFAGTAGIANVAGAFELPLAPQLNHPDPLDEGDGEGDGFGAAGLALEGLAGVGDGEADEAEEEPLPNQLDHQDPKESEDLASLVLVDEVSGDGDGDGDGEAEEEPPNKLDHQLLDDEVVLLDVVGVVMLFGDSGVEELPKMDDHNEPPDAGASVAASSGIWVKLRPNHDAIVVLFCLRSSAISHAKLVVMMPISSMPSMSCDEEFFLSAALGAVPP